LSGAFAEGGHRLSSTIHDGHHDDLQAVFRYRRRPIVDHPFQAEISVAPRGKTFYKLGWKLAAVLGGAPEPLLATDEEERRPMPGDAGFINETPR
jgi:hypothetical protein